MEFEKEHSWLCRQIVTKTHDAIIMVDREGIIRLWNQGAETVFGFSPAEALANPCISSSPKSSGCATIRATTR